jgi:hypothetical protein
MQFDLSQVDLALPIQFGADGYVRGLDRPSYDAIIDGVLANNEDPFGPSGKQMTLGFVAADGKAVYRKTTVWGMGSWMGVVDGLLKSGFIDLLDGKQCKVFDALFTPSHELARHGLKSSAPSVSKYDPLIEHLVGLRGNAVTITFAEVEEILGERLPASARTYQAWWANTEADPTHTWARRWTEAGWRAQVDLPAERVTFTRSGDKVAPGMRLADLIPTGREAVMDLVERAGVDVSAWQFTTDGRRVDHPRANPHYCYDWCFGSPTEGFVLCLWHGDLEERSDRIISDNGVGSHRKLLEQLRDERGIDGARRSRLNQQIRRAREFEDALEQSWQRSLPLRVIINAGRHRLREEIADSASRVEVRALDDKPWYVHTHDSANGRWMLVRSVRPSEDEGDDVAPDADDRSPGADDARRMGTIKIRRGQAEFRSCLIGAYSGKCAVTGSRIVDLLEAAHITPHADGTDYRVSNGLLLRADIHTLYDLHLLSIDERYRVHLSKTLRTSEYLRYHGTDLLTLPSTLDQQPSAQNLQARHERFLAAEEQR